MAVQNSKEAKIARKIFLLLLGFLIISLLAIVLALFVYRSGDVEDLGPRMGYIGREDHWCFVFCSEVLSHDYYFKTDMTKEELRQYFNSEQNPLILRYSRRDNDPTHHYIVEIADFNYKWFQRALE